MLTVAMPLRLRNDLLDRLVSPAEAAETGVLPFSSLHLGGATFLSMDLLTCTQALEPGTAVVRSPILGLSISGSDVSRGQHGTVRIGRLHDGGNHRGDGNPGEEASSREDRRHAIAVSVVFGPRRFCGRYRLLNGCHVGDFLIPLSFSMSSSVVV
jgi:hypothetical protein